MGLNLATIEDPRAKRKILPLRHVAPDPRGGHGCSARSFAVTQALVALLARSGAIGLEAATSPLSPEKGEFGAGGLCCHCGHHKYQSRAKYSVVCVCAEEKIFLVYEDGGVNNLLKCRWNVLRYFSTLSDFAQNFLVPRSPAEKGDGQSDVESRAFNL